MQKNQWKESIFLNIKGWCVLMGLFCISEALLAESKTISINQGQSLFDSEWHPTHELIQLLQEYNIAPTSPQTIVRETQRQWLRPIALERWQLDKRQHPQYVPLFKQLGLVDACYPTKMDYDYALILGASIPAMRRRILFLKEILNQGINFQYLIVLSGDRKLNPKIDTLGESTKEMSLQTEAEAATYLIETLLFQDNLIPRWKVVVINAKGKWGKRPTTADTLREWRILAPTPGSILAISNQPYIGLQSAIIQYEMGVSFEVETVGSESGPKTPHAIYLDTLARWIYQWVFLKERQAHSKVLNEAPK